jgi:hypothetical protein
VRPVIVFFRQMRRGGSDLFVAPKNSGFRLQRFGTSYRYECRRRQKTPMYEGVLKSRLPT